MMEKILNLLQEQNKTIWKNENYEFSETLQIRTYSIKYVCHLPTHKLVLQQCKTLQLVCWVPQRINKHKYLYQYTNKSSIYRKKKTN